MSALHASVDYPMKFPLAKNRNLDNIAMLKWRSFVLNVCSCLINIAISYVSMALAKADLILLLLNLLLLHLLLLLRSRKIGG